ncbi:MAG: leucyl aminopeptidase [Chloroflexi bacterium]|uniref:Probable cytosol aminopeptidase n=1 Tax=Candidatus Chlorohelix allophototropha TaxID=3003348 RepID=A0A8T7LZ33_9CHLR|nr:leucyl aminopeptidase [Chloroflexota bacterium]WJW65622.1 leucyl aminopeptidase [Chloroflexota bacterium L227-S17]
MRIRIDSKVSGDFDALVVGIFSDDINLPELLDDKTKELVNKFRELGSAAKPLDSDNSIYPEGGPANRLLVIGAGKKTDFKLSFARNLAGTAARQLRKKGAKKIAFALPFGELDAAAVAQVYAEGIVLSTFDPGTYRTGEGKEEKILEDVVFLSDQKVIKDALERGVVFGEAANFSRSLAHEPGNNMYPELLAEEARKMAETYGLEFDALDKKRLEEGGFKAILAVGQGSAHEPRMIVLKYKGAGENEPYFGLVGKGITFDSGGISIKPADGMGDMKMDMSGGAWVIGAMRILAQLKPKINVLGIVPAAENMPSSNAYRPGDVIGSLEGKTIEVINTDAEGRIVLADGLTYARQLGATKLVDLATLTGAMVIALGYAAPGIFGTNDEFSRKFLDTTEKAGEKAWQLPLFPEYSEQIKSSIADIMNTGGRAGGSCTAAAFLKEFTGDLPWIHIDIAGIAYTEGEKPYLAKGSSGYIIRSLVDFVLAHA